MLTDLIDVDTLQRIQNAFSDMTGMAALTTDKNGIAVTKGSNFSDFCFHYTRTTELGRTRCEDCDRMGAELTMEKGTSCAYYCHAGLMDFAAPIMADGHMIGSFIGGQVLTAPPDISKFEKVAEELGIDKDEYIKAVKKIRIVDDKTINNAAKFLYIIADTLSTIAYNSYKLYQSNIEIEKVAKAKSDFLANMSHEIRTPMNAVLGMAEMALREEMSPAAKEYLYQIRSSGKNLLVIINDILDFSKIESGKLDIVEVSYEPLSMINDVASIIGSRIGNKDIEFTMDISCDIPRRLYGDNVRIQQIMINLLNNAVKFTSHGRVHLKMYCEPISEDMVMLKAEVSDTGSGIKPEDMGKLFQSFQQVDSKRNRNIEGTGLGLAIAQQLLVLMNGNISVESEYNKGSTFSFQLPQKIVTVAAPRPATESPVAVAVLVGSMYLREQIEKELDVLDADYDEVDETFSEGKEYDFLIVEKALFSDKIREFFLDKNQAQCIVIEDFNTGNDSSMNIPGVRVIRKPVYYLNLYSAMGLIDEFSREETSVMDDFSFTAPDAYVLVVDDNSINLTVAKGLLEPLNMHVDTAGSAAETIEKIKATNYDIIFMDHMMPEVDGVETTHIIRRLMPSYADTPIIALTANAMGGAKEMFIREGMNDFIAKPIDTKDIIARLRKWLPQEKIVPLSKTEEKIKREKKPVIKFEHQLEIEGLDIKTAMPLLGSESLFMAVLKEYYLTIDKRSMIIEEYCNKEFLKDYAIEVHALKSTSRQIGAYELGALAEELEHAGKDGNLDLVKEKTGLLLVQFRRYKEILAPFFPDCICGDDKPKKLAEPVEIKHMLDEFQTALDDFDTLAIDEVVEKMSEYSYDSLFSEYFKQLKEAAENSEIDLCSDIIHNWKIDIANLFINR